VGLISIEQAIEEIRQGRMVIVVDDEDRENEGDLTIAAERITPEAINFMAKHGRGLICLPMTEARLTELNVPMMVDENTSAFETAFTVSIEARHKVTTGISAFDRAATVLAAIDPATRPADLARPGHIFPLRAKDGGVLCRAGQTDAAVDLAKLAGLYPAGVICEIMDEDGRMARLPSLLKFSKRHKINIVTIRDLIKFRIKTEKLVKKEAVVKLPTQFGEFRAHTYQSLLDSHAHVALVIGEIEPEKEILVRVHSECLTGDTFGSLRCDCGNQLQLAMKMISNAGCGVLLYMRQEGRGIGFLNKMLSYQLQDEGKDTVEANKDLGFRADLREYGVGAQILVDLGLRSIRLITNNPRKIVGLEGYNLTVTERVPLVMTPTEDNVYYLQTKRRKLGHLLKDI
jgi:3,4-dihydroxy 2-butanone 4-phosphate synthase/GTP cyclohydrolase II